MRMSERIILSKILLSTVRKGMHHLSGSSSLSDGKTATNECRAEETRWAKFVSINVTEYHYEATFATSVHRRDMC